MMKFWLLQKILKAGGYIGIGAGAHGYIDNHRYSNILSIEKYIDAIKTGNRPVEDEYITTQEQDFEDTIMLGLRTRYGIDLDDIKFRFGVDILANKTIEIDELYALGLIEISGNRISATDEGYHVLNKIIVSLI